MNDPWIHAYLLKTILDKSCERILGLFGRKKQREILSAPAPRPVDFGKDGY